MARTRRIGKVGYARILRALLDRPMTETQLREKCGIGHTAAHRIVRAMHRLKLVHIGSWACTEGTRYVPAFSFGEGPDAEPPRVRPNGRPTGPLRFSPCKVAPCELIAFAEILRQLQDPSTAQEVAQATGAHEQHTRELLEEMRALRLVRISCWSWRNRGGSPIPNYELAPDTPDAPGLARVGQRRKVDTARPRSSAACRRVSRAHS